MCRTNTKVNDQRVNAIDRQSCWRSTSTSSEESANLVSSYDMGAPNLEPGHIVFLRQYESIPETAVIKRKGQLNKGGFGHPLLIVHRSISGVLSCLPMTSFNGSKTIQRTDKSDYRFISSTLEYVSEEAKNTGNAGRPLLVDQPLEKRFTWVNQSKLLEVEPESVKKYMNGDHKLVGGSLDIIRDHCRNKLSRNVQYPVQAEETTKVFMKHRRHDSAHSDTPRADPRTMSTWRRNTS